MNIKNESIDALRKEMGTLPNENLDKISTKIWPGVVGIHAEIIDSPRNPYKTIVECVTATWGDEEYRTKWPHILPDHRLEIVKAALTRQTLPQALEPVLFSFIVRGASRSAFDQHARQRLATFFSQGVRDNSRIDAGFRMPDELAQCISNGNPEDADLHDEVLDYVQTYKKLYAKILKRGWGSFQTARALMPMGMTHNYKCAVNLGSLMSFMAQRLQACEQADIVAVAMMIRKEVELKFPLLANYMRPGCDYAKKCTYHQASTLSEKFGALFAGCGRWPDPTPYATFNRSCSSYEDIAKQLKYKITGPEAWVDPVGLGELSETDRGLMEEDYEG